MGSIVKGIGSLFGGRARRREQRSAQKGFDSARENLENFEFENAFDNMEAERLGDASMVDPTMAQVGQLGPAAQAEMAQLGNAQGYSAAQGVSQGYDSQGYSAAQTGVGNLARGADTGLTNTMNNLQVSTAGSELAAQEADQSLAASQDLIAQTGGGGATALAAAAAKSKAGISANIDQQVKSNEQMRAAAESQLQQSQLAQGNLASQFDLGQQQFNVGATNDASRFGAAAQNQAAQFGAQAANTMTAQNMQAQNQARKFSAASNNAFAQAKFNAGNMLNQSNVSSQNQFATSQFGAGNAFSLANQDASMKAGLANADSQNQFARANQAAGNRFNEVRGFQANDISQSKYAQNMDQYNITGSRLGAANAARQSATNDLIGGITGVAKAASGPIGALLSDRRAKNNIKLVGLSPSGIKIYNFKYNGSNAIYQGVMADEMNKNNIAKHSSGLDMVDYSKIDVEFKLVSNGN
jgi:hypothetical protein